MYHKTLKSDCDRCVDRHIDYLYAFYLELRGVMDSTSDSGTNGHWFEPRRGCLFFSFFFFFLQQNLLISLLFIISSIVICIISVIYTVPYLYIYILNMFCGGKLHTPTLSYYYTCRPTTNKTLTSWISVAITWLSIPTALKCQEEHLDRVSVFDLKASEV